MKWTEQSTARSVRRDVVLMMVDVELINVRYPPHKEMLRNTDIEVNYQHRQRVGGRSGRILELNREVIEGENNLSETVIIPHI